MSLAGNLRTMDLPEILQWIAVRRARRAPCTSSGAPSRSASSSRTGPSTPPGRTTPASRWASSSSASGSSPRSSSSRPCSARSRRAACSGVHPGRGRHVGEEDLRRALKIKAEETIYDLFLWPEGKFEFKDGETAGDDLIPIDLDVTVRHHGGHPSRRRVGAHPHGVPDPGRVVHLEARRARRRHRPRPAAPAGAGRGPARPWPRSSLELRRSEFETAELAFLLHGKGFLAVVAPRATAIKAESDPVGTIQRLLAEGAQRLRSSATSARCRPTSRCWRSTA